MTEDVILRAAPLAGTQTLSSVLAPALPPGSPVDAAAIDALLASLAYGAEAEASSWVASDGRWRLGVARGAWHKDDVEYVGVGARRAARERELAEVTARIAEAEANVAAAAAQVATAQHHAELVERLQRGLPPTYALISALSRVDTLASVAATHRRDFENCRQAAEEARNAATALERDFADRAARVDLPAELAELRLGGALTSLAARLRSARSELGRVTAALETHQAAGAEWEDAGATRERLEQDAACASAAYHDEASQLATLEDINGDDIREVEVKIDAAQADVRTSEEELPDVRKHLTAAHKAHTLADAAVTQLRADVIESDQQVEAATAALARVLATPGLALAAFGSEGPTFSVPEQQPGAEAAARTRQLRNFANTVNDAAAGGRDVSDSTMLKRYEALTGDSGMAAGYEAAQDETNDHVKVFAIHDDTGHHPVAVVARRLTKEVSAAHSRLTVRQEEVFQRSLPKQPKRSRFSGKRPVCGARRRTTASASCSAP